ncbi:MAG: hypothetical protein QOK15_2050 [Nocardioidaceae bacterium]|jgi:uncharacterized protein (TIGR02271 family)|nr:hypothetical protein [Nocardioidaceae bacterium]
MLDTQNIDQVIGSEVHGADGDKIGKVGQVYLDDQTNQPAWVTVNTGLFGSSESFIPVQDATFSGDGVTVPFDKSKVKGAPQVASDGHISPEEEQELYRYYGLEYGGAGTEAGYEPGFQAGDERVDRTEGVVGHDTSGPTTDTAMTRSEEQLRVGTQTQEAGRARLRKYVTTETQTETVPVTKERAVVEREPITDANVGAAKDGPAISEEEHEVVLHEEVPVAEKTVTPVERVRLDTEQVTEQETVSAEVRKEQVEVEGDTQTR